MNTETLRMARNILLRCFVVGLGLALVFGGILALGWETWISMAARWFRTSEATLAPVFVNFLVAIRFFLIFVLLTPALALHWSYKAELKRKPSPPAA